MSDRSTEALLVLKAQAGNSRAFEALYRSYQPSLLRFAYKLCKNEHMAADAVQDAWVTTARTLNALHEPTMFRARIFKAVRWRCLDALRKRAKGELAYDDDVSEVAAPQAPLWATQDQLIALIEQLPEIERQAVYLFYLEELKVDEIAAVMETPPGTIKSRLNRARGRLQQHIEGETDAID